MSLVILGVIVFCVAAVILSSVHTQMMFCHGTTHHRTSPSTPFWYELQGYRHQTRSLQIVTHRPRCTTIKLHSVTFFAHAEPCRLSVKGLVFLCRHPHLYAKRALPYLSRGWDVILVDNRCEGHSDVFELDEEGVYEESLEAFRQLSRPWMGSRIVLVGYCLGSATASYIAMHEPDTHLILIGAFPSAVAVAARFSPLLGWCAERWLGVRFDTAAHLRRTQSKHVYLLHSKEDGIMPLSFAEGPLADAVCDPARRTVVAVCNGGGHNKFPFTSAFAQHLGDILDTIQHC